VNDHLALSAAAAVLVPLAGAEDFFRDDEVWSHYMLLLTVSF
jgi:hypothetical protein